MPCDKCPRRATCRKICPALEAKLPKVHDTVTHGHVCNQELAKQLIELRKATRSVLDLRACLGRREREVMDLVFNKAMTFEEAACVMHTSVHTVRNLLQQAHARISSKLSVRRKRSSGEQPRSG